MIYLLITALCCAFDAWTTDRIVKAGGVEVVSKWLVGSRPDTARCWLAFFVLPVLICAVAVYNLPEDWDVCILGLAAVRMYYAVRNFRQL